MTAFLFVMIIMFGMITQIPSSNLSVDQDPRRGAPREVETEHYLLRFWMGNQGGGEETRLFMDVFRADELFMTNDIIFSTEDSKAILATYASLSGATDVLLIFGISTEDVQSIRVQLDGVPIPAPRHSLLGEKFPSGPDLQVFAVSVPSQDLSSEIAISVVASNSVGEVIDRDEFVVFNSSRP